MLEFINNNNIDLDFDETAFEKAVFSLIDQEGCLQGDLIFVFMSDDELLEMNKELLNHDYFTDVITIDQTIGSIVSGEIMISIDRVAENCKNVGNTFKQELYRVMFHGVLHLIGYNDKSEEEISVMRERENFYLSTLTF